MYRKKDIGIILIGVIFIAIFITLGNESYAKEKAKIPDAQILVIYSDEADNSTISQVKDIVEILTYQSFKVSFAKASDCMGELKRYSYILCYNLDSYPTSILEELNQLELKSKMAAKKNQSKYKVLFIGNDFLKEYLGYTKRDSNYISENKSVGKLTYEFSNNVKKEGLVRETSFSFLRKPSDYTNGKIVVGNTTGYFAASSGFITHIPVANLNNKIVRAAFTKEVAKWKWPYKGDPHPYAQYMVINEVYPFQDPEKLLKIIKLMIQEEEPFVISVMPIYSNGDYPAMQQFAEVLRYAQANGGAIIMHSPLNQMTTFNKSLMLDKITTAFQIYMNQGVYPVALEVPHNWIFNTDTIEILKHFRTIFTTNEDDEQLNESINMNTNRVYKDGHQWVSPVTTLDDLGTSYTKVSSTAVYINMLEDMDTITNKIEACQSSFVPLKSLWDIEQSFWTNKDLMEYKNHIMMVNGKKVKIQYEKSEGKKDFQYNRNMLRRFSKDLSLENRKLIIAVIIVSLLFVSFIIIARYYNRQKYFLHKNKD
ncbi:hypothetical protein bsdtb5_12340 [Anaeromicropila herbilytica]|uniref:DUF2334 domain-containing protein n=2 Tax=Anaeromicropila herbilytica TaxID=2785025 RepID=A0A7R7EJM8_9FIRM|nr:hypothetical protein bsdtb5_12340 [Anaeromicropila herbilytica]